MTAPCAPDRPGSDDENIRVKPRKRACALQDQRIAEPEIEHHIGPLHIGKGVDQIAHIPAGAKNRIVREISNCHTLKRCIKFD